MVGVSLMTLTTDVADKMTRILSNGSGKVLVDSILLNEKVERRNDRRNTNKKPSIRTEFERARIEQV